MFFNRVILVGRLVADPEMRYTPEGIPIALFRLAVDRPTRRGTERQTDFFRIVTFRRLAEFVHSYLTKGRLILVEGRLQTRSYTDQAGMRRVATEIIASSIQFMDRKPEGITPPAPSAPTPLEITAPEQDVPLDDELLQDLPSLEAEEEGQAGEQPF